MLPDFPSIKNHVRGVLLRWAQQQVPQIAPLLGEVGHFRQHEGKSGHLVRADESSETIDYPGSRFQLEITPEEMKELDLPGLFEKLRTLAEQIAEAQSKMMFAKVSEAVEQVGNTVSAEGDFKPEHLSEMLSKVQMEFDPATEQPIGHSFVMHPDTAAKIIPKVKAWEQDPAFVAEHERILAKKREEWRARENRRKLVD